MKLKEQTYEISEFEFKSKLGVIVENKLDSIEFDGTGTITITLEVKE